MWDLVNFAVNASDYSRDIWLLPSKMRSSVTTGQERRINSRDLHSPPLPLVLGGHSRIRGPCRSAKSWPPYPRRAPFLAQLRLRTRGTSVTIFTRANPRT